MELSLSGMDGNYTGMCSDFVYDQNQITYNSHENGDVFDVLHVNNARTRLLWETKAYTNKNGGTAATLVFNVKDGVTGDIKIDVVNSQITAYKEGTSGDAENIAMDNASTSVTIEATQPEPSTKPETKPETKPDSTAAAATAVPAAQTPASPKTGDTANLALYGVLGVACVVALGVVIYRRKKANH